MISSTMAVVCMITALGSWCEAGAEEYGFCFDILDTTYCFAEPEEIGLFSSTYDYAVGGINCDIDCERTASMEQTGPHMYWTTAACPHDWLGMSFTTEYGGWRCNDRGGSVRLDWREVWVIGDDGVWSLDGYWVWIVDHAVPAVDESGEPLSQPWWSYTLVTNWSFNHE